MPLNREPILHRHTGAYRPLIDAINAGDLATVQHILSFRDQRGVPLIDINNMHGNARTALIAATWADPINEDICTYLLSIRDNENNLVVDINYVGPHGQTVFSFLLKFNHPETLPIRTSLLNQILNTRDAEGNIIADVNSDCANMPLLCQALMTNIDMLRILLDLRDRDGQPALNPNFDFGQKTLLDIALKEFLYYVPNQAIIQLIQEAGGVRMRDLTQEQIHEQQRLQHFRAPRAQAVRAIIAPVIIAENIPQANVQTTQRQINQFENNQQNTHDPIVEQTSKSSLLALEQHYRSELNNLDKTLAEINELLNQFDYNVLTVSAELTFNDKKDCAVRMWSLLLSRIDYIYSYTGQSHKKIISLIWAALLDKNIEVLREEERHILPPGQNETPEYILKLRKAAFIECLINADREYRIRGMTLDICIGGAIHAVLNCLNKGHSLVVISTGDIGVKQDANDIVLSFLADELRKKPLREMREILHNWDNENSAAGLFRTNLAPSANQKLISIYGPLLNEKERKEITDNFEYLSLPNLHDHLTKLLQAISKLTLKNNTLADKNFAILKEMAKNAYSSANERTLDEEYQFINRHYHTYKLLDLARKRIFHQCNDLYKDKSFLINRNLCFGKLMKDFYSINLDMASFLDFERNFKEFLKFDSHIAELLINLLPLMSDKDRVQTLAYFDELYFTIYTNNNIFSDQGKLEVYLHSLPYPSSYLQLPDDPVKVLNQMIKNRLGLICLANKLNTLQQSHTSSETNALRNQVNSIMQENDGYLEPCEYEKLIKLALNLPSGKAIRQYSLFGIYNQVDAHVATPALAHKKNRRLPG